MLNRSARWLFLMMVLVPACGGSESSDSEKLHEPCAVYGPQLGCACDTEGGIACSAASASASDVVVCMNGTYQKSSLACPHGNVCESLDAHRVYYFEGTVACGISAPSGDPLLFSVPGARCAKEGQGGCSFDLHQVLRCTNTMWTAFSTCSGSQQCAFVSGSTVGCI